MSDEWESMGRSLVAVVPDYDAVRANNQKSLLRLGAYEPSEEWNLLQSLPDDVREELQPSPGTNHPGWLEYTDGDRTVVVHGNNRQYIAGSSHQFIGGTKTETIGGHYRLNIGAGSLALYNADPVYKVEFFEQDVKAAGKKTWRKREMGHVSQDSYSFGDCESFFGGYKFDLVFGLTNGIFVGGKLDIALAIGCSFNFGYSLEFGAALKYSNVAGGDISVATNHEIKAREAIHLRVKTAADPTDLTKKQIGAIVVGTVGVVTAAGLTGGVAAGEVDDDGFASGPMGFLMASGAVFLGSMVASLVLALMDKQSPKISATELKLEQTRAFLSANVGPVSQASLELGVDGSAKLSNVTQSSIELDNSGLLGVQAGTDLILSNGPSSAMILCLANGDLGLRSTTANIGAQIVKVGLGGALRVQ